MIQQAHDVECDKPSYCWCPVVTCAECQDRKFLCATCEDVRDGFATLTDLAEAAEWTA